MVCPITYGDHNETNLIHDFTVSGKSRVAPFSGYDVMNSEY